MTNLRRLLPSRRWLFVPPTLIGVVAVAWFASSQRELVRVPAAEEAVSVRVVRAARSRVTTRATGFGTAQPSRVWTAVVEVPGTITTTHSQLRSGNRVAQGDLLVEIDDLDYRLRVSQREAELASARAGVEELLANEAADRSSLEIEETLLRVTEKELKRLTQLQQTSSASQSEADRAESDLLRQTQSAQKLRNSLSIYPSRIAAARANVTLGEARLDEAKRDLERTKILAPFAGVLSGVEIEPKQVVSQAARLFELHDTDTIEINSQFSPSQIIPLLRGQDANGQAIVYSSLLDAIREGRLTAIVTAHSGQAEVRWPGTPVRVAESIDPMTRTLGIVIRVDNTRASAEPSFSGRRIKTLPNTSSAPADDPASGSDIRLFPGVYCEVTLSASEDFDSITIPSTAADGGTVYVVTNQDRLEKRNVTVTFSANETLVVTEGIEEGDLVAIKPPMPAIEGMLVIPEVVAAESDGPVASLSPADSRQ